MAIRVRDEGGIGLIELLIAMTVMSIAIFALVAGLSSGITATNRADKTSTAGVFADEQMENLRRVSFTAIALDPAVPVDATYTADGAYDGTWSVAGTCAGDPTTPSYSYCSRTRTRVAKGTSYRIDTYVRLHCVLPDPSGSAPATATTCSGPPANRPVKQVTVVVRDSNEAKDLIRETSTFDRATGS